MTSYDMCVEFDVLCDLDEKLHLIKHNLENIRTQMDNSINRAQDYLAGEQYEKAKRITETCVKDTTKTEGNIEYAMKYLSELMAKMEEYNSCKFEGVN